MLSPNQSQLLAIRDALYCKRSQMAFARTWTEANEKWFIVELTAVENAVQLWAIPAHSDVRSATRRNPLDVN